MDEIIAAHDRAEVADPKDHLKCVYGGAEPHYCLFSIKVGREEAIAIIAVFSNPAQKLHAQRLLTGERWLNVMASRNLDLEHISFMPKYLYVGRKVPIAEEL